MSKIIDITASDSFGHEVPLTYRQAKFLKLALDKFSGSSVRRVKGTLGDTAGSCACLVGLFTDNYSLSRVYGYDLKVGGSGLSDLPQGHDAVPGQVTDLGEDFLSSVISFSDNDANWFPSGNLTTRGARALDVLITRHGLNGIADVVGLSDYRA